MLATGLAGLRDTLSHELRESWLALADLLFDQGAAAEAATATADGLDPASYAGAREAASQAVLLATLDRWERVRPLKRAELAIEAYHRGVDDLIRRLPTSVEAIGTDVLALAGTAGSGLARRIAGLRRIPWKVDLRGVGGWALRTGELAQVSIESRYLMAMAAGVQELRRRWDRTRAALDAGVATAGPAPAPIESKSETVAALDSAVDAALGELDQSFETILAEATRRLVGATAWRRTPRPPDIRRSLTRHLEHWAAQLGSLERELRFEQSQDAVERNLLTLGEGTCAALEAERGDLLQGIDQFVARLTRAGRPLNEGPRAEATVVPALKRTADLSASVRQILDALPAEVELVRRLDPAPRRRAGEATVAADRLATEVFERVGRPRFEAIFETLQAEHITLVQQIERARQVVDFASEEQGLADDASVIDEALVNARSLLEASRQATPLKLTAERAAVARTLANMFVENRLLLSRTRLGALAHLGRLGARKGTIAVAAAVLPTISSAARTLGHAARRLWRRFLIGIQWLPAAETKAEDVVRRPYLPREFTLDPREKDLPLIYRRLFRFDAVDDARFLVGRDREIQALAEARSFWETGRPVAALVVGERGSGKTSLINCAIKGPFAGLELVRGELNGRLASAAAVREFIAGLCQTDPAGLEDNLLAQRRVLVLEETERGFLRAMGGFGGIRELQRLIAATCTSTLWVLVVNQHAFHFLDAAVGFGTSFSHRLNAASVTPEAVRQGILIRHNLSGLRLRFVPPLSQRSLLARLRRRIQGEGDAEQLFFAALARESAGVFRTAFELWLGQIDSVQAGTLVMKPVTAPDIDAVIDQLDADDRFTLLAIMQHGSLTPEEHAIIFRRSPAASRAELDELLAREFIEPEPTRPGFRIRPGAIRVAREALHRRNLA